MTSGKHGGKQIWSISRVSFLSEFSTLKGLPKDLDWPGNPEQLSVTACLILGWSFQRSWDLEHFFLDMTEKDLLKILNIQVLPDKR